MALQAYGAKSTGIAAEQQSAIDDLIQSESEIHQTIRDAVYEYYKDRIPNYRTFNCGCLLVTDDWGI